MARRRLLWMIHRYRGCRLRAARASGMRAGTRFNVLIAPHNLLCPVTDRGVRAVDKVVEAL
jgi:hypothetical protein